MTNVNHITLPVLASNRALLLLEFFGSNICFWLMHALILDFSHIKMFVDLMTTTRMQQIIRLLLFELFFGLPPSIVSISLLPQFMDTRLFDQVLADDVVEMRSFVLLFQTFHL